ncbi:MAG: alpha/beta fold hydrolase [Myxococcales bacterium]|nr:alpha/beta fold hydrolase [Myxococcales bacterium]
MPPSSLLSIPVVDRLTSAWSSLRVEERAAGLVLRNWGFRSRWMWTSEGPVHALVRPAQRTEAGPPIVLLHGLVASGADFFPLLRRLTHTGRMLVAPDLPGHGLTPAPHAGMHPRRLQQALEQALRQLLPARSPAVVYGSSLGGLAALRLALHQPDLVGGLVLASPGGAPLGEPELSRFLERFRMRDTEAARSFVRDMRARPSWVPVVVAWGVRARFGRPEVRELLDAVDDEVWLSAEELSGLRQPAVVLWGKHERILVPAHRDFFLSALPGHVVFEEPDWLGHAAFLDDPDFIARHITQLRITPSGPPAASAPPPPS